jgi:hypothetical protein
MGTGVSASFGFPGSINAAEWSTLLRHSGPENVAGCAVTAGGGTRQVNVAAGTAHAAGTYHTISGGTFYLAENVSGRSRIDVVVLDINWSAGDAGLAVVQGTPAGSPSRPALARNPGNRWQVPLATILVASGAGVLTAGAVEDARTVLVPLVRRPRDQYQGYPDDALGAAFVEDDRGRGGRLYAPTYSGVGRSLIVPRIEAGTATVNWDAGQTSATVDVDFSPPFDTLWTAVASGSDRRWNVAILGGMSPSRIQIGIGWSTTPDPGIEGPNQAGGMFLRWFAIGE